MIKEKIVLMLTGIVWLGMIMASCTNDASIDQITKDSFPLNAFAVRVGDSYYHGKIDQNLHRVEIGAIDNPNLITGLDYSLQNDSASVSPDPATFIGSWKKEQTITVTTDDNKNTTYTIVLTKFDDSDKDVIFFDDFVTDGIPDNDKWVLSKKASSDWNDEMSESYDQAYVEDGVLVLVGEKVDGEYKAGGIETNGKFDFTFGKVEVRARISRHPDGAFPAIWMMPRKFIYNKWPNCGEIDIMEHIKQEPYIHQTLHTHYTYTLGIKNPPTSTMVTLDYADWNTYGIEWTEDKITFLVNGVATFTYPNLYLENEAEMQQWPFTKDSSFYIILNMGLGGDRPGSWAGKIDDNNLPAKMEVDWVKVSKLD